MAIILAVLAFLVFAFLGSLFNGWLLMLLLGAVHNSVFEWVPALGFWQSVIIALVLWFIGSFFKNNSISSNKR